MTGGEPSVGEADGAQSQAGGAGRAADLGVRVDISTSPAVVRVSGDLDFATAPRLVEVLSATSSAASGPVVVDLSQLTFMDATGLRVLANAHVRLLGDGRPGLVVRGATGIPRRLLELTGLGDQLHEARLPFAPQAAAPPSSYGRRVELGRRAAGWSVADLFVAYFGLGGTADLARLHAFLNGHPGDIDDHQHDVLTHALNERFIDRGQPDLVLSYIADGTGRAREAHSRQRHHAQAERHTESAAREEAAKLREAATPGTGLAMAFSQIARYLYEADSVDEVLSRITATAVSAVTGCDRASVTVRENGSYRTVASTDPAATAADKAQYRAGEGPCLEATDAPMIYAPAFPDPRWPILASQPGESGLQSVVSYRLAARDAPTDSAVVGSLNVYATAPDAFAAEAQEVGLILAAHASVAARAVGERAALKELARQLHEALFARDVINQAKGILMERLHISPEDAFDALRRSSHRLNLRLQTIAENLTTTGQLSDADRPA